MADNPSAQLPARLVVEQGPEPDKTFTVGNAPQTIGRSANNGIVINDAEISRRHAQLTPQADSYVLEDLGSTNGTFVNGLRLEQPTMLNHGDSVEFGDTVQLRFWAAGMPSEVIYNPADDVVTPALPPEPVPAYAQPADLLEPTPAPPPTFDEFDEPETAVSPNRNRILIGCGCLLVLACVLCVGTVFFLDSYQQGELLYCGGLRPFWETVLGPVGFNPACP
ncbi:FHA domain-containing protein [Candidatus Leptofilum sp.]|uniref:FHA domain-containing protein n=1 Tax=Candidatus Leptofilum sp. TaxID=3241576 RepID=UPI003B59B194